MPFFSARIDKVLEYDALCARSARCCRCGAHRTTAPRRTPPIGALARLLLLHRVAVRRRHARRLPGHARAPRLACASPSTSSSSSRSTRASAPRALPRGNFAASGAACAALRADYTIDRDLLFLGDDIRIVLSNYIEIVHGDLTRTPLDARAHEWATHRRGARRHERPATSSTDHRRHPPRRTIAVERAPSNSTSSGGLTHQRHGVDTPPGRSIMSAPRSVSSARRSGRARRRPHAGTTSNSGYREHVHNVHTSAAPVSRLRSQQEHGYPHHWRQLHQPPARSRSQPERARAAGAGRTARHQR